MGIGDDIKPKVRKTQEPEIIPKVEESRENDDLVDGVEIPIEKNSQAEPVYEDLVERAPKPFDHLKEAVEPQYKLERIKPKHTDKPVEKSIPDEKSFEEDEKPVSRSDSFKSFAEYHERQPKKSHLLTFIIISFVALLALLLVLQNYDQIKKTLGIQTELPAANQPNNAGVEVIKEENINTPVTSNNPTPTTEVPTEETEETVTPVATPETTPAPDSASDISTLKVKVLNGNGISGSAATIKTKLEGAGYTIGTVTNASKFTYTKTVIYYNTNKKAEADALAAVLTERQTEVILNASVTNTFDIVVVVGKT